MSNYLKNVNLSHDPRDVRLVLDHVLLKDLDCHLLLSQLMDALSHFSKCSLSDGLAHHVVADKPAIGSFLSTLGRLPVTLLSIGLFLLKFS